MTNSTYKPLAQGATPTLGTSGDAVKALQTQYNTQNAGVAGYTPLKVDGLYGPLTQAASQFKAPVAGPTSDPLNGVRRYTGSTPDPAKTSADAYYNNLNTDAPNAETIRRNALNDAQAEIDAINNIYNGLVTQEQKTGIGRLGSTRATAARSGTLGGDFGNADLSKTEQFNNEKVQAIRADQAGKIAEILGRVNTRADAKFQAEQENYFKNAEAKLNYQKKNQEDARADLKNLASTGVGLDQLTQEEYNSLIEQTGYDDNDLKAAFTLSKPKADIIDKQVIVNKYYQVSRDPITGKVTSDTIDLGFTVPPNYKPQQLDDGTLVFVPDKIDPSKALGDQVIMYGHQGQFAKPKTASEKGSFTSGSVTFSGDQLSQFSNELEASKKLYDGDGKYVNPESYQQAYDAWVESGALAKDFIAKFPPAKYVNPANTTLPSYLLNPSAKKSGREI